MQTKHLCVLIHIWTKCEVGALWKRFKPSSKIFLLTVPRRCFFCGSFMLFLSYFCYAFLCVCLLMPCGHLLGKGCPLCSRLWCHIVKLSLSHWYPRSAVVLDCIDSWSLPSFFLCQTSDPLAHQNGCDRIFKIWSFTMLWSMTTQLMDPTSLSANPFLTLCRLESFKRVLLKTVETQVKCCIIGPVQQKN